MSKKILIDNLYGMVRAAILDTKLLTDYFEEYPGQLQEKGNIYRGQVKNIENNLNAAFIDYGSKQEGFLP